MRRILGVLAIFCWTGSLSAGEIVDGPLGRALDELMSAQAEKGYCGALLVARDGKIVLSKGYGWADREKLVPASAETAFSTGSITKQFTAAAILKLEEQGKLRVADSIDRYFEDVPEHMRPITLHHLLTHSAGFPAALGSDEEPVDREAYVDRALRTPLRTPPGREYHYSNVGYSLLAAIVEKISGQGYERFLREHFFQPAGMTQTGYVIPEYNSLAHGYQGERDWGTMLDRNWAEDGPYWNLRGNGGILSTVEDMYRWHQALQGDSALSPQSKEKLFAPHIPEGPGSDSHYGYGWTIREGSWGRLIRHNGGNPVFKADFLRFVDRDAVVIIFSSRSDRSAFALENRILPLVLGEPPASGGAPAASAEFPDTLRGRLAAEFAARARSEDSAEREEFIRERFVPRLVEKYSAKRLSEMMAQVGRDFANSRIHSVQESGGEIRALLQNRLEEWLKIVFLFDEEPLRFAGFAADFIDEMAAREFLAQEDPSAPPAGVEKAARKWRLPGSPTGQRGTQLLTLFDAPDPESIRRFYEEDLAESLRRTRSLEETIQFFQEFSTEYGEFELTDVRKTGPHSAQLELATQGGKTARVNYELEADPPHRISGLAASAGEGIVPPPSGSFSDWTRLDEHLRQESEAGRFSGVVLVDERGESLFHHAYGLASKRFQVPNRLDTRFNIGSLNKLFTAVAILQLAERGALKLEDPVGKHLEGFPAEIADRVTVRHLLQHRSGWGAYWDNEHFLARRDRLRKVADYMEFIRDIPLDFEPGSRQQYSNVGYEVLGAIVEAASGVDYYDYVRANVFAKAGMTRSDSPARDATVEDLAVGYTNRHPDGPEQGFQRENTFLLAVRGTPAGGGHSTAEDLLLFKQALLGNRLLSRFHTDLLLNRFEEAAGSSEASERTGALGFGGGAPGVNAALEIDLSNDRTVIVLSNFDPPTAERTARLVAAMQR